MPKKGPEQKQTSKGPALLFCNVVNFSERRRSCPWTGPTSKTLARWLLEEVAMVHVFYVVGRYRIQYRTARSVLMCANLPAKSIEETILLYLQFLPAKYVCPSTNDIAKKITLNHDHEWLQDPPSHPTILACVAGTTLGGLLRIILTAATSLACALLALSSIILLHIHIIAATTTSSSSAVGIGVGVATLNSPTGRGCIEPNPMLHSY